MWVAIDCHSKNWVAVLKSLGSTGPESQQTRSPINIQVRQAYRLDPFALSAMLTCYRK
jgi:hypothetical protein